MKSRRPLQKARDNGSAHDSTGACKGRVLGEAGFFQGGRKRVKLEPNSLQQQQQQQNERAHGGSVWGCGPPISIARAQIRAPKIGGSRAFSELYGNVGAVPRYSLTRPAAQALTAGDLVAARLRSARWKAVTRRSIHTPVTAAAFIGNNHDLVASGDSLGCVTLTAFGRGSRDLIGSHCSENSPTTLRFDNPGLSISKVENIFDLDGRNFAVLHADGNLRFHSVENQQQAVDQMRDVRTAGKSPTDCNMMVMSGWTSSEFVIKTFDFRVNPRAPQGRYVISSLALPSGGTLRVSEARSVRFGEESSHLVCCLVGTTDRGIESLALSLDSRMGKIVGEYYNAKNAQTSSNPVIPVWNKMTASYETPFIGHPSLLDTTGNDWHSDGILDARLFGSGLVLTTEFLDTHKVWQVQASRGFVTFKDNTSMQDRDFEPHSYFPNNTALVGDGRRFYSIQQTPKEAKGNNFIVNEWCVDSLATKDHIAPCFQFSFPERITCVAATSQALACGTINGNVCMAHASGM